MDATNYCGLHWIVSDWIVYWEQNLLKTVSLPVKFDSSERAHVKTSRGEGRVPHSWGIPLWLLWGQDTPSPLWCRYMHRILPAEMLAQTLVSRNLECIDCITDPWSLACVRWGRY